MFHVALIYTCNMKENALASCIHMHRHIASSRVWVHGNCETPKSPDFLWNDKTVISVEYPKFF